MQVLLNRVVVDHANDVRRKSLLLRFPKDKVRKKRRHGEEECDYLEKRKSIQRRKTNPEVNQYMGSFTIICLRYYCKNYAIIVYAGDW